jgi:sulfate/thiosulfate transport system permease protein
VSALGSAWRSVLRLLRWLATPLVVALRWLRPRAIRVVVITYLVLLVGLPVGYLFYNTFSAGFGAFWTSITQPAAVSALELSAKIALVVVPVNTIVGIGAALLIARRKFFGRRFLDLTFDVPIAVSPIIIGAALFFAYAERIGWFGPWLLRQGIMVIFSPVGIALATMAVSLPYVLRSVMPVLVELGETQEVAARTLGAGPWRRFFTITLPAIRWGVLYGVTLTLARSLGEFGAVLLVSGNFSNTQTVTLFINNSVSNLDLHSAFCAAVVLASISIAVLVVLSILRSREKRLNVDIA